jgi:hypothetical protein
MVFTVSKCSQKEMMDLSLSSVQPTKELFQIIYSRAKLFENGISSPLLCRQAPAYKTYLY